LDKRRKKNQEKDEEEKKIARYNEEAVNLSDEIEQHNIHHRYL
jgi:hypothetical protein